MTSVIKIIKTHKEPIIKRYKIRVPSRNICFKFDIAKKLMNHNPKYTLSEAPDSTIEWYNNEYTDIYQALKNF